MQQRINTITALQRQSKDDQHMGLHVTQTRLCKDTANKRSTRLTLCFTSPPPNSNSLVFCAENLTTTAVASPATISASTSPAPALPHPTRPNRASAWDQDSTHNPPTTFVQRPTTTVFICRLPAKSPISLTQACTPQDCPGRCGRQQQVEEEGLGVDQRMLKVPQSLTPVSGVKVWAIFLTFSFSFSQWDHWMSVYLWIQMRQGSDACRLHL